MKTNIKITTLRVALRPLASLALCAGMIGAFAAHGVDAVEENASQVVAAENVSAKAMACAEDLRKLSIPAFHVQDVETASVISLAERYLGELSPKALPAFVLHLDAESIHKKISVEADDITGSELLKRIAAAAGAEVRMAADGVVFEAAGRMADARVAFVAEDKK